MKFIKTLLSTGTVLGGLCAVVNPAFAQNWTKTSAPWGGMGFGRLIGGRDQIGGG
jgi:hypothetical protein